MDCQLDYQHMLSNKAASSMIIIILHLVLISLSKTEALGLGRRDRLGFRVWASH